MYADRIVREYERKEITGIPYTSWRDHVKAGLAVPSFNISKHAIGWLESELAALNAAKVSGKSNDEIRTLVAKLVTARKHAFDKFEAA